MMMNQDINDLITQIYDEYPHTRLTSDSNKDQTRHLVWLMNLKRNMRNKRLVPCPAANATEAGGA